MKPRGPSTAIRSISGTIKQINEISDAINEGIGQQSQATQEISASVQSSVQHMSEVSTQIADVASETDQVRGHSGSVMENAESTSSNVENLDRRMDAVISELRSSGNRRQDERVEGRWKCEVVGRGITQNCHAVNISRGGALLSDLQGLESQDNLTVKIEGLSVELKSTVVQVSPQGVHISFDALGEREREVVSNFIKSFGQRAA